MLRTRFCVSRKGGTGGGGWGHLQRDMHMVAARLGLQSTMAGTGWANSRPSCMDRLRKRYSHLVGGSFLAGKAAWALSRVLTIACLLMSRCGQGHKSACKGWKWSWVQF